MGATWATFGRLGDGPARGALSELWKLSELTETDAREVLYHPGDGSGDVLAQLWRARGDVWTTFQEKHCNFMISTPLCSGIGGLGGWGHQVGAVWTPRWLPRGGLDGWPRTGPAERSGQQKDGQVWPVGSVFCRSYGNGSQIAPTQPRTKSRQRSKSV